MRRIILALAPALLATAALAQPAAPHHPPGAPAEARAHHEAMRKQHREDLKTLLRLRPDQEAALDAFLAAGQPKRLERRLPAPGAMTTPQRLDEMARAEDEMAAHRKTRRDALAKFYAALSPDQQRAFDALHRLKGHGAHGGRMMRGHGHMGGPKKMMMMRQHGPGASPRDD